jgi:hypothetical protein
VLSVERGEHSERRGIEENQVEDHKSNDANILLIVDEPRGRLLSQERAAAAKRV